MSVNYFRNAKGKKISEEEKKRENKKSKRRKEMKILSKTKGK
jgi:hypothetical protein